MANKYITEEVFKKSVSDIMQTMADNTYEFEPYDDETIASAFELSSEEQRSLSEVINDTVYAKNKVYSSEYTLELLEKAKAECNQYAVEQLANSGNLKRKIVSSDSEVTDENILYLILTDTTNNIYTQYMLIDGIATPLGNTQIDLSDYLLIDDFNTTIADYAKKTEVVSQNDVVNDLTTVSSSTVLSSQGTINELDKKVDKTSIVTSIDSTSTDEQVASAKAVYDKVKDNSVKTYCYLSQLGLTAGHTVQDVYMAMDEGSIAMISVVDGSCTDTPDTYGILVIEKQSVGRVNIVFKQSHNVSIAPNYMWIGTLKGIDGTGLTWKRVCTTSVADVAKTSVTVQNVTGSVSYSVNNGICYVALSIVVPVGFTNGTIITPVNSLPNYNPNCSNGHYQVSKGGLIVIREDGSIKLWNVAGDNVYGSFSYPVAES